MFQDYKIFLYIMKVDIHNL